jgi:hypothetical protein
VSVPIRGEDAYLRTVPLLMVHHCVSPREQAGEISGLAFLSGGISNFLRAHDGTFTTFSIPESSNGFGSDTAINPAGTITGYYFDANGVAHGFLRKKE